MEKIGLGPLTPPSGECESCHGQEPAMWRFPFRLLKAPHQLDARGKSAQAEDAREAREAKGWARPARIQSKGGIEKGRAFSLYFAKNASRPIFLLLYGPLGRKFMCKLNRKKYPTSFS